MIASRLCGVCIAVILAGSLNAQTIPTDTALQHAEQALSDGQPNTTVQLTNDVLGQEPDNFAALLLLSLGLSELGQHPAAAKAAGRAYHSSRTDDERLQAARLAGGARFSAGQYTRGEWWLRRAANHTATPQDRAIVGQEFQKIRASNPLSIALNASVAPSNNINGGSEAASFFLEGLDGLEFFLPPDQRALSGVEYVGDVQLSYKIAQSPVQITSLNGYVYARTYTLTPAAKDSAPDISGNDYALGLAELSLSHQRLLFDGVGPTSISAHIGRVWFDDGPLWNYHKLGLGQDFRLGQSAQLSLQGGVQEQTALDNVQPDTAIYDLSAVIGLGLANQDQLQFTASGRLNDAVDKESTFTDYRISMDYGPAEPVLGANWRFSIGAGYTNYDDFFLSLDGRRDRHITVGGTATFTDISYFGFSPSLSISATQTDSNVSQYDTTQVQGRFGVQSDF